MSFGYDADVVRALHMASGNTIRDHGKALAVQLGRARYLDSTTTRPLIFIVHSMGGLVCEQALLISRGAAEPWMQATLDSTFGIIFMGTPHAGANIADWGKILARMVGAVRRTNQDIPNLLRPGSKMLATIQQEFHTLLEARQATTLRIFCFFEELPFPGIGYIVPRESAILPRYPSEGMHDNHTGMVRFADAQSHGYQNVSGQLQVWLRDIRQEPTTAPPTAAPPTDRRGGAAGKTERETVASQPATQSAGSDAARPGPGASRVYSGTIQAGQVIQGDVHFSGDGYIGLRRQR